MELVDPSFKAHWDKAIKEHEFGQSITSETPVRIVQLSANRVQVVRIGTDQIYSFREYEVKLRRTY